MRSSPRWDLPVAAAGEQQNNTPSSGLLSPLGPTPTVQSNAGVSPGMTSTGQPIAPRGPKKHIPLDVLLD